MYYRWMGALVILVMLTNALSRSIRLSPLRKPDRILGAGFGVLCTWAVLGTAFLFYGYLGPRQLPPAIEGSATFPPIRDMAMICANCLPMSLHAAMMFSTSCFRYCFDGGTTSLPSTACNTCSSERVLPSMAVVAAAPLAK